MKKTPDKFEIYGLHNGDGVVRYVGMTVRSAEARMKDHRKYTRYEWITSPLYNWMRKHGAASIQYVILQQCADVEELKTAEREWIAKYRAIADPELLNVRSGGDCYPVDPVFRKGLSFSLKGRPKSETTKQKLREAALGNTRCLGRECSEETRVKQSLAHRTKVVDEKPLPSKNRTGGEANGNVKLTEEKVLQLRSDWLTLGLNQLAEKYGISRSTVKQIVYRKTWRHV